MPTVTRPAPRRNAWGTIRDAAEREQVSTRTIRRWIARGLIRAERIGPRLIRVDLDSLDQLGRPLQYRDGNAA